MQDKIIPQGGNHRNAARQRSESGSFKITDPLGRTRLRVDAGGQPTARGPHTLAAKFEKYTHWLESQSVVNSDVAEVTAVSQDAQRHVEAQTTFVSQNIAASQPAESDSSQIEFEQTHYVTNWQSAVQSNQVSPTQRPVVRPAQKSALAGQSFVPVALNQPVQQTPIPVVQQSPEPVEKLTRVDSGPHQRSARIASINRSSKRQNPPTVPAIDTPQSSTPPADFSIPTTRISLDRLQRIDSAHELKPHVQFSGSQPAQDETAASIEGQVVANSASVIKNMVQASGGTTTATAGATTTKTRIRQKQTARRTQRANPTAGVVAAPAVAPDTGLQSRFELPSPPAESPVSDDNIGLPLSIVSWEVEDFIWPKIVDHMVQVAKAQGLLNVTDQLLNQNQNRLIVSAGKRGQGTTTVAMVLAKLMADSGKRVLLIDADLSRPGLSRGLGLPVNYSWLNLIKGNRHPGDAIVRSTSTGISVMPMSRVLSRISWPRFFYDALGPIVDKVKEHFDAVIIDGGPADQVTSELSSADRLVDAALVVNNLSKPGFGASNAVCTQLNQIGIEKIVYAENFVR